MRYIEIEKTDDGLWLKLTKDGREEIGDFLNKPENISIQELIEDNVCNDELRFVYPEEIGALTDAPILSTDFESADGEIITYHDIYWFPDYAILSVIEELDEKGKVLFSKG